MGIRIELRNVEVSNLKISVNEEMFNVDRIGTKGRCTYCLSSLKTEKVNGKRQFGAILSIIEPYTPAYSLPVYSKDGRLEVRNFGTGRKERIFVRI